ncbi:MAG TPA: HAD-IA family hydrolase [Chloroflexi bacterium]|jgi:HAD superfamily hydrolase (TIGR01509 family)|nr:HAD-IA family hydrolase [Anaerolineaceae bacterium]HHX08521.1 HAD-IA family hydrolase [Chloroflexota bacterium]
MTIKAIFFDQDGVIIDTERDGHRVAFNETFKKMGFETEWDVEYYHELLQVGGGKERMKKHLHTRGFGKPVPEEEEEELIKSMHRMKTDLFIELIESGSLPLRPGIHRFMKEGEEAELVLGVCTTSNERAAHAIAYKVLHDIPFKFVLAGDVVAKKKPDPAIYLMALEKTGLLPEECLVVEDSRNGVLAAKAAGMHVVATSNFYTQREDLSPADVIVTCLGDPYGEKGELIKGEIPDYDGVLHVEQLTRLFD